MRLKKQVKWYWLIVGLMMLALGAPLLGGCDGDDDDNNVTPTPQNNNPAGSFAGYYFGSMNVVNANVGELAVGDADTWEFWVDENGDMKGFIYTGGPTTNLASGELKVGGGFTFETDANQAKDMTFTGVIENKKMSAVVNGDAVGTASGDRGGLSVFVGKPDAQGNIIGQAGIDVVLGDQNSWSATKKTNQYGYAGFLTKPTNATVTVLTSQSGDPYIYNYHTYKYINAHRVEHTMKRTPTATGQTVQISVNGIPGNADRWAVFPFFPGNAAAVYNANVTMSDQLPVYDWMLNANGSLDVLVYAYQEGATAKDNNTPLGYGFSVNNTLNQAGNTTLNLGFNTDFDEQRTAIKHYPSNLVDPVRVSVSSKGPSPIYNHTSLPLHQNEYTEGVNQGIYTNWQIIPGMRQDVSQWTYRASQMQTWPIGASVDGMGNGYFTDFEYQIDSQLFPQNHVFSLNQGLDPATNIRVSNGTLYWSAGDPGGQAETIQGLWTIMEPPQLVGGATSIYNIYFVTEPGAEKLTIPPLPDQFAPWRITAWNNVTNQDVSVQYTDYSWVKSYDDYYTRYSKPVSRTKKSTGSLWEWESD